MYVYDGHSFNMCEEWSQCPQHRTQEPQMESYEGKCGGCSKVYPKRALTRERCDQCRKEAACATFPTTFSLRGHEGLFRASVRSSYISGNGESSYVMVYTQRYIGPMSADNRHDDSMWSDFAKGTVEELKAQVR